MNRIIPFLTIVLISLFAISCETGDPAQVYGWTPNPGINGPRVMTKVDSASVTQYEFLSTSFGVIENVNVYQTTGIDKQNVYYNSLGKIANMKINELTANKTIVNLSYDAEGRVSSITQENYDAGIIVSRFSSMLSYNGEGKLIHLEKLTKYPQTSPEWVAYTLIDLTYNGLNVVKVEENTAAITTGGVYQPMDPATKTTYEFENFDYKNNPFRSLTKEYNITMGVISTLAFHKLSHNNFFKMTTQVGTNTPEVKIWSPQSVVYDDQGYPVSDQSGVRKFSYKAIP